MGLWGELWGPAAELVSTFIQGREDTGHRGVLGGCGLVTLC